jgi:hypothetical protein
MKLLDKKILNHLLVDIVAPEKQANSNDCLYDNYFSSIFMNIYLYAHQGK